MDQSNYLQLFDELYGTLFYIEQWVSPSSELFEKLGEWVRLDEEQMNLRIKRGKDNELLPFEQVDHMALSILRSIYRLETELNNAERTEHKLAIIGREKRTIENFIEDGIEATMKFFNTNLIRSEVEQKDYLRLIQMKEDRIRDMVGKVDRMSPTENHVSKIRVRCPQTKFVKLIGELYKREMLASDQDLGTPWAEVCRHFCKKDGSEFNPNDLSKEWSAIGKGRVVRGGTEVDEILSNVVFGETAIAPKETTRKGSIK